jgi:DNA-binding winged helix-turn-helix (wHTH) protein
MPGVATEVTVNPGFPGPRNSLGPAVNVKPSESNHSIAISFGPFHLLRTQRLLLDGQRPVRLGSRALDILIALVERAGQLVSKRELMAVVWPDTVVVEANLTVHVVALRRALGDGQAGNRYIVNICGRGYQFVAPVMLGTMGNVGQKNPAQERPP